MNRIALLLAGGLVFSAGLTLGRQLPGRGPGFPDPAPGDFLVVTHPDESKPTARTARTLVISGIRSCEYPCRPAPGGWAVTFNPGTPNQRTYLAVPGNLTVE